MSIENIVKDIEKKYQQLGENPETYLKGLLQAKPITYWDYIQVDTLLSLQKTRTDYKDEVIFVMYHQVTELVLNMMVHELKQLVEEDLSEAIWIDKINRLNRYTAMLITSFDVMRSGMNYDDYNTFRATLAPASGFQSATFRYIEIYCTRIENLINEAGKKRISSNPTVEEMFENIYWIDAGLDRKTGNKSLTLRLFEEKYLESFITLAKKVKGNTIEEKVKKFKNPSAELLQKLKEFDDLYNIKWPLVHLETAQHYLDSKGENKAATGGSEWKKYLHPKYQQRKFFPEIWTKEEILNWGNE
ncbi:MAG: tryptophan 2,3-dioxygenase [Bacteroidia bacterium]|nr:tryptophan 2,3-dioxygenase [Bacteroidia bacterium]MCC7533556.1 tryptophan 2,3-dioxygenase [Bacteroidia bacterium]